MIYATVGQCDAWWFGVAWSGNDLVATASGTTREDALRFVLGCVPRGVKTEVLDDPPESIYGTITMLGDLERGNEENKRFRISKYVSGPMRKILGAAAAIPIGYVSTYGAVARAAGSEARAVGRAMATNPLYPVVPCHRVVGSDMSLVGYGGKQDDEALGAKLARLEAEARGAPAIMEVRRPEFILAVYPVERLLEAVRERDRRIQEVARKQAELEEAEKLQLRLF